MKKINESHALVMESLTSALLQLMEKKPFSEINVTELCSKAGVSRVSFYRNFNSMQDILTKHLRSCTDEWWKTFLQKPENDFYENFWSELLEQYKKNNKLIALLYKNNVSYLLKEHIFSCCGPKSHHSENAAYLCAMLAGMIFGLVDEWIRRGMTDTPNVVNLREIIALANSVINL